MTEINSKADESKIGQFSNRYLRQLPLFGEEGQFKLATTSVFIAGAGGLGSPVATYLAAAGVGRIVLLDGDTVDTTNLNRQFLHCTADIGREKAQSGVEKLSALNPEIQVSAVCERLTKENVAALIGDCNIIVDALDNDETRLILAEFAVQNGLPYFHAAVSGFSGQFAAFYPNEGPCYFCVFSADESKEKKTAFPIVGATAGIVGSMEAGEVIKYITGKGKSVGKLFIWDGLNNSLNSIDIEKDENCPVCGKQK
jgi:Dinucleotide-utilizing enzymes involved in molybdopterin and thiamine biosynthesis family 2